MNETKDLEGAVYRIALPLKAKSAEKREFKKNLSGLKDPSSGWTVFRDWAGPGERSAFVIISKNDTSANSYTTYRVTTSISRAFFGGYSGKRRF